MTSFQAIVGVATYILVKSSLVYGSFEKLLEEEDYSSRNKQLNQKLAWFPGSYWLLVTLIFLSYSFIQQGWAHSWMIWPLAGLLFPLLLFLLRAFYQKRL